MAVVRKSGVLSMVGALICLSVCALGTNVAFAAEAPSYLTSFGPDGTASTGFEGAGPIAVDQGNGVVYVVDHSAGSLLKFSADGTPLAFTGSAGYISGNAITGLSLAGGAGETQVAVNSADHTIYVTDDSRKSLRAFQENGEPALFTAGPGAGTNTIAGFYELLGVAVNANGSIYASDYGAGGSGTVTVYASSGEPITSYETSEPANIAVDSNGVLYVNRWHGTVFKFTPSEFPVTSATTYTAASEPVDPNASYTVAVDSGTNDVYIAVHEGLIAQIAWYDQSGVLLSAFGGAGEDGEITSSEGIGVDAGTGTVYVSNQPSGLSQVEIFGEEVFEPQPPTIDSVGASGVTADSATLQARINPNTLETTYRFEYGLGDCSAIPSPCASVPVGGAGVGAGHEPVTVSRAVGGLQPNTIYHYRVVAENSLGATPSTDRMFTTQVGSLAFELSDSRGWEMVSPTKKFGGVLRSSSAGAIQAAENGEGLVYQSLGSIEAAAEGNRAVEPATVLARRGVAGDWHSKDLTPPHTKATTVAAGTEYDFFSPNLGRALLEPRDSTPLSVAASERTPYLRENSEPPVYTPLVTTKEGFGNVPSGTVFGGDELHGQVSDVIVSGADRALSHVVLASRTPLTTGAASESLYEWAGGQLQPVSALPATEGGTVVQGVLGSEQGSVRHAVSEDGSRVFWSPGNIGTGSINLTGLYLRDTIAEETTRLDVAQPGASEAGDARPAFQGASADGTVVFFTDSQQLTVDASPSGRDLYRCEISSEVGPQGCETITTLSAPRVGAGESAEVQGLVPAFSEDGARLYFVAFGVLDAESNLTDDEAVPGEPNLYLWQEGEGPRFVVTLSNEDDRDWGRVNGETPGYARTLSAAASPNGRYFSFMSERSLTGYDNGDTVSGELDEEVYVYDATTEHLACVSCSPSGANPEGQQGPPLGADPQSLWAGRWAAATLPELTVSAGSQLSRYPVYRPRAVLDNGRIFFNAVDSLVSADSNGNWDVYQYEPTGVGSCGAASSGATVSRPGGACVSLLSSGAAAGPSTFLDASADGSDVFFLTAGRLSVTDNDTVFDVYDARVNGIAAVLHPPTECAGEACRPSFGAPLNPAPTSQIFRGSGNAKHCPRGKRKVRRHGKVHCVRRHKQRRHPRPGPRQAGQTGGVSR
jgi:hypothetical protein